MTSDVEDEEDESIVEGAAEAPRDNLPKSSTETELTGTNWSERSWRLEFRQKPFRCNQSVVDHSEKAAPGKEQEEQGAGEPPDTDREEKKLNLKATTVMTKSQMTAKETDGDELRGRIG
jgi:hypothetical protein